MKYKSLLLLTALILSSSALSGQHVSDSRTFMKAFRTGNNPVLDVSNKYGNLHVSHINGDSIKIRVEVTASSNDESRLNKLMSDVNIGMTMTNETVRAQTILGKNVLTLFESIKGMARSIINFESRLQINYFIECPPETILRLSNSYGDVYIGEETPELSLTLSNGNFDADVINNAITIELTFCNANIRKILKGRLSVSYGELSLKETGDLDLNSRSTKIRIEKAASLDVDSKRDVMILGSVETITGTTYFSEMNVDYLSKDISLVTKYGNISFEEISSGFSLIDVNSSYADFDFSIAQQASYNMEIHHTNAFVSLPGVTPEPQKTEISAENKVYLLTGKVGSSPERARIRIDATKGEIRLFQK